MKHRLLSLLFACCIAVTGFAAIPYSLNESFESGIPSTWTQEVVNTVAGGEWILDTLATNPTGAYDGEKRVALRAEGGNVGYCVRLVTPEMDLSQVSNPQLSFAYAQPRRGSSAIGYFSDTLSVYFRTSSSAEWILIRKYSDYQAAWSLQTIDLPAAGKTATCQLAFEAKENGGYGVILDQVRVFPQSQCMDADLLGVTVGSNAARISWAASPRRFEVIVSTSAIADLSNYDTSSAVYYANNLTGNGVTISNLQQATHYYAYVRTDCDDNESGYTNWVSTDFTTVVGLPYTPGMGAIPSAWSQKQGAVAASVAASGLTDNSSSYKWNATTNTAVFGAAHLYAQSAGTPSWLLTQSLDITNIEEGSSVLLSFQLALTKSATATTASTEKATSNFHVFVSPDDGDTWVLLRTIAGSEISNTGSAFKVTLDEYIQAGAVRVAFVADAQSSEAFFHLYGVSLVESDGLCLGLYGLKPIVSPTAITLNWSKIGQSATEVTLSDAADFSHILQQQTVAGVSHTFSGLTPSGTYYVSVRQDCEGGDSLSMQLKTPCVPGTITTDAVYTEDFESYTGAAFDATDGVSPECWMVYTDGSVLPHVIDSVGIPKKDKYVYTHSGEKSLTFYGKGNCYAVLPGFTNELNTLRLSFWVQMENASKGELTLGYITDGDVNMNTFHEISTYKNNTGSMTQYTVDLSELPSEAKYLVFRWYYNIQYSCCIDDVELRLLPQCKKVKNVAVVPGLVSSTLTFTANEAPGYDVLVTTRRMNPDTLQTTVFTAFRDTVTGDTVAITGLAPTTTYYAYVHPICSAQEADVVVDWSDAVSFTTPCGAISVSRDKPWTEDFESYPGSAYNVYNNDLACWEMGGTTTYMPHVANSGTYGYYVHSGTKALSFYGSSSSLSYAALPIFSEALNLLQISFWVQMENVSNGVMKLGYITNNDPGDFSTFTEIETLTSVSSMTNYDKEFSALPAEAYRLVFCWEYSGTTSYYTACIDDIEISLIPTCHKMGAVSLMTATASSATLRFEATNASQYQVVVSTSPINPATANLASDTVIFNQLVSTTQPVIPSLEGNNRYYAYVRGYCGGDDYSTWSAEFSFKTLCTAITPEAFGTETFRDEASADCWTFGFTTPGSSTNNAYAGRETAGAYGAYLKLSKESVGSKNAANVDTVYSDGAYGVSPELAIEDIRDYQITFDAATTSTATTNYKRLNIGVLVDPNDLSGIDIIKTINLDYAADSTALKTYTVSFANYEGDYMGQFGKYVIFQLNEATKHDSTNYVLIDNITFEPVSGCEQVVESSVDSLAGVWAGVSWENTGAAQYQVLLSQINTRRPDTISAPLHMETVSVNHILFTELTGNTDYYAYIRAICADGDSAKWSNATVFHTTQTPVVPPYSDDFEDENHWLFLNGTAANAWAWGTAANNGGTHALYISEDNGLTNTYDNSSATTVYATKYVRVERNGTYIFQYDWKANGESNYDYLRVALVPGEEELIAGAAPFTTTTLPNTWIALDGGSKLNLSTAWDTIRQEIRLSAGLYKVVLAWKNDGSGGTNPPAAIDNFSINEVACPVPTGLEASLTSGDGSVATLIWKRGDGEANAWVVEYSTHADMSDSIRLSANDSTVALSGLIPETVYYARVKAACGPDTESEWSNILSFLPTDAYSLLINDSTATNDYVPVYGYYVDDFTRSQFVVPASDLASIQWGSITQLTFYANDTTIWAGNQFEVYMAETPATTVSELTDWSTMRKVADNVSLSIVDNKMTLILNSPYQYEGGNLLIGFKQTAEGKYKRISWYGKTVAGASIGGYSSTATGNATLSQQNFLPKMSIYYVPGEAPACLKPSGITADYLVADTARISVSDLGADGYHFVVATAAIGIDSITAADAAKIIYNDTVAGDTVLKLTGLHAATLYYVYARSICNDEHSAWATPYVFRSACMEISDLPYRMTFDDVETGGIPSCWTVVASPASSTKLPFVTTMYAHSGSKSFAWGTYPEGYSVPPTTWVSLPPMTDDLSGLQLSFWYRSATGSYTCDSLIVGVMTDPEDSTTFVPVQGFQPVSTTYTQAEVNFSSYAGTGKYIAFKRVLVGEQEYDASVGVIGGYRTYYEPFNIDDVKVNVIPTCLPVTGLTADSIGESSAQIRFNEIDNAAYDVVVASALLDMYHLSAADSALMVFSAGMITDTVVPVNGLRSSTRYYAYVRTHCDNASASEWTDAYAFVTACGIINASADNLWSESFNGITSGIPDCWSNAEGTTTSAGYKWSYYASGHDGACLSFDSYYNPSGSTNFLATPSIYLSEDLGLSFWWKNPTGGAGEVLVSNDGGLTKTSLFSNLTGVSSWTQYELDLSAYTGDTVIIYFKGTSNYGSGDAYLDLDDVALYVLPQCKKVQDVAASGITSSSAKLTFSLNGAASYDVLVTTAAVANPDTLATANLVVFRDTVTTDTVRVDHLAASSTFYAYIRALCDNDEHGAWSNGVMFGTECEAISSFPWTEDFEAYATGSGTSTAVAAPLCYASLNAMSGPYAYVNSDNSYNYIASGKYLFFNGSGGSSTRYAHFILPEMASLNELQIRMQYAIEGTSSGDLVIGYMTDITKQNSFVAIETLPRPTANKTAVQSDWVELDVIPDSVLGDARLAIRYTATSGWYATVDNIEVALMPACREIKGLNASAITTSSAVISFSKNPSPEYDFVVTNAVIDPDTLAQVASSLIVRHDTIDTVSVALSGLQQQTDYHVYVRGICSDTETSAWTSTSFATLCLAEVPYSEDFDDVNNRKPVYSGASSEMIPSCWMEGYASTSYVSYIQNNTNSSTYAYSGTSALRLYSSSTNGSYVVLPELNAMLDTLQLTFKARAMYAGSSMNNYASSTYAHSIKIGTMTDPTDFSTFQLIDTYELAEVSSPTLSGNYWEDVTVYFQGARGKYIALVSEFDKSNYVWIDDLEVSKAPDCLAPSGISVAPATTSASVNWSSNASSFEVALGAAGFALPAGADTVIAVSGAKTLLLENLEPATAYDLYVRAECGEGLYSEWSRVISFATASAVPFVDNFEDANLWTLVNGTSTNAWAWGEAVSNGGTHSLYISNNGGTSYRYSLSSSAMVYAVRNVYFEDGGYIFSYDWKGHGESTWDYLRVALVPETTNLVAGTTATGFSSSALPEGWVALDGGSKLNLDSTKWTSFETEEIYVPAGTYKVVLAWKNDGSGGSNPPAAVDNFAISQVECSAPGAPRVSDITHSSAVIRWDSVASVYEAAVFAGADTVYKQMVFNQDTLLLTNLSASTSYTVKLRVYCDDETVSNWSAPASFATECGEISVFPWLADFDQVTAVSNTHVLPICWDYINTCTYQSSYSDYTIYPTVLANSSSSTYSNSGTNSVKFYSYYSTYTDYDPQDQYAILPRITDLGNKRLTLHARAYSTSYDATFTVGVMTNPSDASTFVALASFTPASTDYQAFVVPLYSYTGSGQYIAIKMAAANASETTRGLYMDDVLVEEMDLSCLGVEKLVASHITTTSVQLDFRFADGQEHNAQVAISKEAAYDATTAIETADISDTTYVFNLTLEDETTYYLYARQACGEGEYSAWEQISFNTPYIIRYAPDMTGTDMPAGWENYSGLMDDVINGSAQLTPFTPSTYTGWHVAQGDTLIADNHFVGDIYGGTWNYWLVSPMVSLATGNGDPNVVLTFTAARVPYSSTYSSSADTGVDDRLAVLVSTDNGNTWRKLAEWNNSGTGDYVYNDLTSKAQKYYIDLSAYANQSVKVAFYGESTQSNADNYVHIGNVVVNRSVALNYAGDICDGADYAGANYGNSFYVTEDDYTLGSNTFVEYRPAANGTNLPDTVQTLNLTVHAISVYEHSMVLCEGEPVNEELDGALFSFTAQVGMADQVRFVPNAYGCEDVVKLHVTVNAKQEEHLYDSVAQGEAYKWHGKEYIQATVAQFDTVSTVTGCDSIVYLHLSVYQKPVDPDDQAVDNITAQSLIIAPNPVKAGEPIHILNSFSSEMLAEARIEIISATGALVYAQHGADKPFILPGIAVSGVYTVRIVIGNEIFISSLLVH